MREAIAADGEAHRALLAGEDAREPLRRAANAYRASWEAAPPRSYGRLVGYAKASILAGENPGPTCASSCTDEGDSPPAFWALALAALADGDDEAARRAADGMLAGSEAFGRAAGAVAALARRDRQAYAGMLAAIVADFEARQEHLTGVADRRHRARARPARRAPRHGRRTRARRCCRRSTTCAPSSPARACGRWSDARLIRVATRTASPPCSCAAATR